MVTEKIYALQEFVLGFLGIGLSFSALILIYKIFLLKNRENLALIEKGMDPSQFHKNPGKKQNNLKMGLMFIGVASGIVAGYLLNLFLSIPNFVAYSAMILIFCGTLLIYYHRTESAKENL